MLCKEFGKVIYWECKIASNESINPGLGELSWIKKLWNL